MNVSTARHPSLPRIALAAMVLAFVVLSFAWLALSDVARGQEGAVQGDVPQGSGVAALVVTTSSTPAQVSDALAARGCEVVSLAVTQGGQYVAWVAGAPAFVNASFPATLPAQSPLLVRCSGVATGVDVAVGADITCTSPLGFTLTYPSSWSTNDDGVAEPCRFFNPRPFEVVEGSEVVTEIYLFRDPVPLETVRADFQQRRLDVIAERETTVAGRPAFVAETRAQGGGVIPAGTREYTYHVSIDAETTLIANATELPGHDFAEVKAVLDAMMATVSFP